MYEPIGQILVEMGVLDQRQVKQILDHQKTNPQKFGQVAVAWGWATREDVWEAWARQLACDTRWIDLDEFGLDSEAVGRVPEGVARHYMLVPVRAWGDNLVLATAEHVSKQTRTELQRILGGKLHFCLAEKQKIAHYLDKIHTMPSGQVAKVSGAAEDAH